MKKYFMMLLVALCAMGMQAQSRVTHYLCVADSTGNVTKWKAVTVDSVYFEAYTTYDFVDLGLTSGTLWATANVGANAPDEAGDYFAWGETSTKASFGWSVAGEYRYGTFDQDDINFGMTKYNTVDELLELEVADDDAARAAWQSTWRIANKAQWDELIAECSWVWKTQNSAPGYEVVGPNGNAIFLPAVGKKTGTAVSDAGTNGGYWSASLYNNVSVNRAWYLNFSSTAHTMSAYSRYVGFAVRPISTVTPATPDNPAGEEEKPKGPDFNGHDYVDLGLPSGLLWATCNIGAATPDAYGDYYAWGETTTKSDYSWSTYKYGKSSSSITKYCTRSADGTVDNKTTLEPEDDAAHVNWGGDWRMPTNDEYGELINNCTRVWTTQNGKQGYLLTSKTNGNKLFLPCAGYRNGASLNTAGSYGYYWSSSVYESSSYYAWYLGFNSSNFRQNSNYRCYGQFVRPVCAPLQK